MQKILSFVVLVLLFAGLSFSGVQAQSSANYTLNKTATGSLTDMTSGATTILTSASVNGDFGSPLTNIGFTFYFMSTPYTNFSVSSNGYMRLGGTINSIGGAADYNNSIASTNESPCIAPFWDDLNQSSVPAQSNVVTKITGSTPNRVLNVQWQNYVPSYDAATSSGLSTFEARIYEATGQIEFVYGNMEIGTAAGIVSASIGFTTGAAANAFFCVSDLATFATSTSVAQNTLVNSSTPGQITQLSSAGNGSRVDLMISPGPLPAAATALNFTAVTPLGMTLNWTDNATNETGYTIYRSTDNVNFSLISTVAANATSSVQTGLAPSTIYYWRVYAVNEGGASTPLSGSQSTGAGSSISSNGTGGGLWSAPGTWAGGNVPTAADNVTIVNGDIVTIDGASSAYNLTVSGTLMFEQTTARTLTVANNVTINTGGTFQSNTAGTVTTHVLSLAGNLTNNGTLDFSTNANTAAAGITFTGATNNTFSGTGAITDLRTLTINKGVSNANILELMPSTLTIQGVNTDPAGFLTLTNGTLKVSGTFDLANRFFTAAAYTIPATAGFWLNNSQISVVGQNGSPTNNGLLRITQGLYNVGSATGNSIGAGAGAVFTIEGGTLNVAGRLLTANAITYNQSGGAVNVATIGNAGSGSASFSLSTGTFNFSAGTITIVQINSTATATNRRDFVNLAASTFTGGTLILGTGATTGNAGVFDYRVYGYVPNMIIDNTTNNKTVTAGYSGLTAGGTVYIGSGNITINPGTTFSLGGYLVVVGGNLINNGTINGNTASSRLYFQGAAQQTYSGTGIAGTVATPLISLDVDNTFGLVIDPSVSNLITNRVIIFGGNITNSNKITIGVGGASAGTIQLGNTTTPSAGGAFDVAPTFNLGTAGLTVSALRTTLPINLNNVLPPSRLLTALTINPDVGNTVNLTGGDLQVGTTLTLTTGSFNLGGNTLTLGTSTPTQGTLSGTVTNIINGKFKRWIVAGTAIDFPIGTQINTELLANGNHTETSVSNPTSSTSNLKVSSKSGNVEGTEYMQRAGQLLSEVVTTDTKTADKKVNANSTEGTGNNTTDALSNVSRKVTVNFTAVPTPGTLTAEWVSTPGGSNGLPLVEGAITVDKTADDGFWRFTAADGLAGGTYDITATGTSVNGVLDFTQLVLLKRSTALAPWTLDGTHITTTGSNAAPVLSRTGITSGFSDFVIGGNFAVNPLPVELASFTSAIDHRNVSLNWSTTLETNNAGFDIERRTSDAEAIWSKVGFVAGAGNSTVIKNYTFSERNLATGNYSYRLKQMDNNGNFAYHNLTNEVIIGLPTKFELSQNYPNPFNPSTKINFDLPFDSKVQITLFDMTGRQVATILNANQTAGYQTVSFNASNLSSGAYFYQINATGGSQSFVKTMKMMLVK